MVSFAVVIYLPLHVARQSVVVFWEVNPINCPTHSPSMKHCKADVLSRRDHSTKMKFFILIFDDFSKGCLLFRTVYSLLRY